MKKFKQISSMLLASAMMLSTISAYVATPVKAAFTGSLTTVDSATANGNVVEISFNDGAVKGRITFLEDNIFRYNVDPSGEFGEYADVRGGYPDTAKIQAQPDDSDRYSHPTATVNEADGIIRITNGTTTILFDKDTALMTVKYGDKTVMEESAALALSASSTVQTLVQHDASESNSNLDEQYFGGGTQNGRFVHTGESINIANESKWVDGGVSSPNPFYYTTNGYGVLRNTYRDGVYDFGSTLDGTVTATHNENEFDAYYFVSGEESVSDVTQELLQGYFKVTGNPVLLPEYGFYLGHLNAYNRDAWSSTEDIGANWTIKGNESYQSQGTTTYEAGGTGFEISAGQQSESLNGYGPTVATDNIPEGVTYPEEFSARAVLDEYLEYDMPFGFFLPNDGYGAGYGRNGYNVTGGVDEKQYVEALNANLKNLEDFADYAAKKGVATGLWTQSALTPESKPKEKWHLLRDFEGEVAAGVTTLKTDVAWVGPGYSFQLSGVKQAYDIMTTMTEDDEGNAVETSRPNIISLDGWAGSQRYNSVWTGDQTGGNWEYIRFHIPTFIGQSLSGNPNIGSDMDGIWGGDPIIATRDYQWKSFAPQMLDMDGWGSYAKGPYVHGDPYTGISRMYLKLKAQMMPYIYTNAYAAANLETGNDDTGLPMIRAMFLEYTDEALAYEKTISQYQYMWGESLLVAPVYQDTQADNMGNDVRNGIYLPGGEDQIWIDYFTGEQYRGGQILTNFDAPLWKIPLFVKNGAIIPMYEEHNTVSGTSDDGSVLDKSIRLVEFWPAGTTDFSVIEDDGSYIKNELDTSDSEYGEIDNVSYGEHVTTKYTSVVEGTTATLTAEKSTGEYTGYDSNKDTTFIVHVSKAPESIQVFNGTTQLEARQVSSKAEFDAAGENETVWFYDANPAIETYASESETKLAEMVKDIEVSPKLYVKFAVTDTQANEQKLVINGFANEGDLESTDLNKKLEVPALTENEELKTPSSITLTWNAVDGAASYQILADGTIDDNGNVLSGAVYSISEGTTFTHADLEYKSNHTYRVRAVNVDGHSAWSNELQTASAEDPFMYTPTPEKVEWTGNIYGGHTADRAFDQIFQNGDEGFHSDGNAIGQTLTVDYGVAYELDKIEYYPRNDAGNGTVTQMKVETSLDGVNWVDQGTHNWSLDSTTKLIDLKDPNTGVASIGARYIRFTPLASLGDFFSASEIKVYTVENGTGYAASAFRAGNISSVGTSEPTLATFQQMFQKESSAHGSYKDADWVGEVQKLFGDINFNGIADVWDYAFTAFYVNGGTTKTGSVSGDIMLLPSATTVSAGDTFTIDVTALDVANLNAYGSIINYDPNKLEYVGVEYVGTGGMYTQGMTGNINNGDGTAYINHNAINMGDQPLVSGSKVLATITMRATTDVDLSDASIVDLSTVTLIGPDFSVKESKVVSDVTLPGIDQGGKLVAHDDIIDAVAQSTGPTGDGNDIWASLDGNTSTYTNSNYNGNGSQTGVELAHPQVYTFTLKDTMPINKVGVQARSAGAAHLSQLNSYVVFVSLDGTEWTQVATKTVTDGNMTYVEFDAAQAKYVKLELTAGENVNCVSTSEVELYRAADSTPTGIEPTDDSATSVYVGYVGDIDAIILPEGYPNQYFTVTSSKPEVASIITLADENGDPIYKVLGVSAGETEITLTSAADSTVTKTYTLTVIAGVDKSDLIDAINKTMGAPESIYTEDSYAAYKSAYEKAVEVKDDQEATRADVESATAELLAAYDALEIVPVDSSLELDADTVVSSASGDYSESNTADRMFDNDLSTYWESPYGGSNANLPKDVVIELNDTYVLEQISFISHTIQNGGVTDYTISVSEDGSEWTQVTSGTVDANEYKRGNNVRVDARFVPVKASYIKFTVNGAVGRIPSEDNMYGRIAEMIIYGSTDVNKTALSALYDANVNKVSDDFTPASWTVFQNALTSAKQVLDDNMTTQEAVDNAYEALDAAVKGLALKADFSALDEAIKNAESINTSAYTPESVLALDKALEDARLVLANENATQDEVDAAVKALKEAISGLRETTDPETPTDPSDPTTPTDPETPTDPDTPVDPEKPADETPTEPETPTTGDNSMLGVYAGLLAVSVLALFVFLRRKKEVN